MQICQDKVAFQLRTHPNQKVNQQLEFVDNRGSLQAVSKSIIQKQPNWVVQAKSIFKCIETPDERGRASMIHAEIYDPQSEFDGGIPKVDPVGWNWLTRKARTTDWVRFHILNQFLGGSGNCRANLIPTNKKINNGSTWRLFEDTLKKEAKQNLVVYDAEITGYHDFPSEPVNGFPKGIAACAKIVNVETEKLADEVSTKIIIDPPSLSDGLDLTQEQLNELHSIETETLANRRVRLMGVKRIVSLDRCIKKIANQKLSPEKIKTSRLYDILRRIEDIFSTPQSYGSFTDTAARALKTINNHRIYQRPGFKRFQVMRY